MSDASKSGVGAAQTAAKWALWIVPIAAITNLGALFNHGLEEYFARFLLISIVFGGIFFLGAWIFIAVRQKITEPELLDSLREKMEDSTELARSSISKTADTLIGTDFSMKEADPEYFAAAHAEIGTDRLKSGMWAKALVLADADEKKQQVHYIKLRVRQMQEDEKRARQEQEMKDVAEKTLREKNEEEEKERRRREWTAKQAAEEEAVRQERLRQNSEYWGPVRSIVAILVIVALLAFLFWLSGG